MPIRMRFDLLAGTAVGPAGDVYVADALNSTIRKVTPAGFVTTLAGAPGIRGHVDGAGSAARFDSPFGLAVDAAGTVYVSDACNNTIRKILSTGVVTTLAGYDNYWPGSTDAVGAAARFNYPAGIAVDAGGNVYVADSGNFTIRKITPGGAVTTVAGSAGSHGHADGAVDAARFTAPRGVKT